MFPLKFQPARNGYRPLISCCLSQFLVFGFTDFKVHVKITGFVHFFFYFKTILIQMCADEGR